MLTLLCVILAICIPVAECTTTSKSSLDWEIVDNLDPNRDTVRQLFEALTTSERCDIPVLEGKLSSREFRLKYWNKSPVIIRNAAKNWPGASKWTKDYLIRKFGGISTQYGTSTGIIRNGGQGNEHIDFGDYVEMVWGKKECANDPRWCPADSTNATLLGEEKYLFDRENFMKKAAVAGINMDMNFPAFFRTAEVASERYSTQHEKKVENLMRAGNMDGNFQQRPFDELGSGPIALPPDGLPRRGGPKLNTARQGKDSDNEKPISTVYMFLTPKYERLVGVGMHQHTDGWNAQVAGEGSKLWFLYPPQLRPGPEHPVQREWCCGEDSWIRHYLPTLLADKTRGPGNLKPLLCTQQTGDIVYIPEWWNHGTLSGPGPTGKSGLVGVAAQLVEPSGELRELYQARSMLREAQQMGEQTLADAARKMFRDHVKKESLYSFASANELLNDLMGKMYKLEATGANTKLVVDMEEYKEASNLIATALKKDQKNGMIHAHASTMAKFRNDTSKTLFHIRSGKFSSFCCCCCCPVGYFFFLIYFAALSLTLISLPLSLSLFRFCFAYSLVLFFFAVLAVTYTDGKHPDLVIMFAQSIRHVLGGEDNKQATSRAIATIRAGITHPAYLENSGIDVTTYAKAMVVLLQGVMYQWTELAIMYPYDLRVRSLIKRARQDLSWIQRKYPGSYAQMAEFMRQDEGQGNGGGGGDGGGEGRGRGGGGEGPGGAGGPGGGGRRQGPGGPAGPAGPGGPGGPGGRGGPGRPPRQPQRNGDNIQVSYPTKPNRGGARPPRQGNPMSSLSRTPLMGKGPMIDSSPPKKLTISELRERDRSEQRRQKLHRDNIRQDGEVPVGAVGVNSDGSTTFASDLIMEQMMSDQLNGIDEEEDDDDDFDGF